MIDRAIVGAFGGIALDEAVIHEAVKAVMAASAIEPQQMIAQQRQLFLLAQGPDAAPGGVERVVSSWFTS